MQSYLSSWLVKHGLIHRSDNGDFTNKAQGFTFHCYHFICI